MHFAWLPRAAEFMVATRRLHCMRGEECATSVGVHDLRAEVALLKGQVHEAERSAAALRAARDEHAARAGDVRRRIEEGEQEMEAARSAAAAFWEEKGRDVRALRAGISEVRNGRRTGGMNTYARGAADPRTVPRRRADPLGDGQAAQPATNGRGAGEESR